MFHRHFDDYVRHGHGPGGFGRGLDPNDAKCGYACHTAVAAKDYIFTEYPKH